MFRRKALDITARQVRAHGAVAEQKVYVSPSSTRSIGKRSFHLSRSDTLPTHFTPLHHQQPTRNISAPVTKSPQYQMFDATNEVQPPDLAHHPAMQGRGQGQPF